MDYITLMAKKSKSDWMLEKWAEANGYLDDPEPSVDVKAEQGDETPSRCPTCHADLIELLPEEVDWHLSGHSGYRDTHPSPDSLREDEGRWDKPSSVERDISCPLCTKMQTQLYSTDTPQPDLEREYGEHLSKQHGLKPEEADQTKPEPCDLCGDPNGHWIPGGIFLCDACDKATKPEEEVNMDSFDGLYNLQGLKGYGYEAKCNICGQTFSMSAEETNKFQYPLIEIKTQISNHFSEAHPDKKNPIGEFFEEEGKGRDIAERAINDMLMGDYYVRDCGCIVDSDGDIVVDPCERHTIKQEDRISTNMFPTVLEPDAFCYFHNKSPLDHTEPEQNEDVNYMDETGEEPWKEKGDTAICDACGEELELCRECHMHHHLSRWNEDHKDMQEALHSKTKKEASRDYAGTCPRCDSDNTKKTKSQTGTTIGLCNDCGETWKLKEAPEPDQKGGEIPLGKAGKPSEVSKVSKPVKQPLQPETSPSGELPQKKEPDPSNPDKELNPNPELPPPVDTTAPDSDNHDTSDKTGDDESIHMKPQTYSADGVELPDKVEIPERLFNDLMMMIEYSTTNDNEAGGFLIVAEHGNLGVVGEQFGKDREIVLEPNEQLHEGEQLIGTVHMHPVTPTASTGDVTGYLNDENEQVMVVVGADKSINFFFKIPGMTHEGDYGDEISDNFEQGDMGTMAEGFGFIWYRGEESDRTELHLMDNIIDDLEFDVLDESWPVEDVVKALGIKGRPDIPEEYSTKKTPLRLQVPFSYCTDYKTLKG